MLLAIWLDIVVLKKYMHKCFGCGWAREIETCLEFSGSALAIIWNVYVSSIKQYPVKLPATIVNYGLY